MIYFFTSSRIKIRWEEKLNIIYQGRLNWIIGKYTCLISQPWLMLKISINMTVVQETTRAYYSNYYNSSTCLSLLAHNLNLNFWSLPSGKHFTLKTKVLGRMWEPVTEFLNTMVQVPCCSSSLISWSMAWIKSVLCVPVIVLVKLWV